MWAGKKSKLGGGRPPPGEQPTFRIQVSSADAFSAKGQDALRDMGVDECHIAFRNPYTDGVDQSSIDQKTDQMATFAARFIR